MKRLISSLLILLLSATFVYADVATRNVLIREEDTSPSGILRILNVTNDTLTDNGSGNWSLQTSVPSGWTRSAPSIYPTTITDNVGIGTSSPISKLNIYGTVIDGFSLLVNSGDSNYTSIQMQNDANSVYNALEFGLCGTEATCYTGNLNDAYFGQTGAFDMTLITAGEPRMTIDNNGNVGIGVTTPIATLDVMTSSATAPAFVLKVANSTPTDILAVTRSGNVGIGTTAPLGLLQVGTSPSNPSLFISTGGNVGISNTAPFGVLSVGTNPAIPSLTILNTGNVGIGTTNPQALLQAGTANSSGLIVQRSGNVGIGTTSPATALDVNGNITLGNNRILFTDNGIQNYGGMGIRNTANSAWTEWRASAFIAGDQSRFDANSLDAIDSDGGSLVLQARNTGVGQAEVARLQGATDPYFQATNFYSFKESGNVGIGTTNPEALLQAGTANSSGLFVLKSGNVGIGNTNPTARFMVESTAFTTSKVIAQFNITNGDTAIDATVIDPVACVRIPNNSIITGWYIDCDQTGSIALDVWKNTWDDTPEVNGDSIAGTEKPTLSADVSASDTSLSSMTTDWNSGQNVCIEIESASTCTKCRVQFVGYND